MKKAVFVLWICLCAGTVPVFSSGAQEESFPPEEKSPPEQVIVYSSMFKDPLSGKIDKDLIHKFEEENPGYHVEHTILAYEEYIRKLEEALLSQSYDLLTGSAGYQTGQYIDSGLIMDISDVWEEQGWNDSYAPVWGRMSSVEGKKYFLPLSWYWWGIYYRPSVFEKYGLSPPENKDDLIKVCDTLMENGITPFALGTKNRWPSAAWFDYLNMRMNGPEFHAGLMQGEVRYDDPRVKSVFSLWGEMIDRGYFMDNHRDFSWAEVIPHMLEEQAGMYLMGNFLQDSFPAGQRDDLDFFRFPVFDVSLPLGEVVPTDLYFIPAGSPQPGGAKALIAFFGSKSVQEYMVGKTAGLSAHSEVDKKLYDEYKQKGIDMVGSSDYIFQFYDRSTETGMADRGMDAFSEIWENHSPDDINRICRGLEQQRQARFSE